MQIKKPRLTGVMPAVTTPFTADGNVDIDSLVRRCDWLLNNGCDGINLLGTTGEGSSLSVEQRLQVMESIAASALPLSRLMISTGASALAEAKRMTRRGVELGYAGVLLLPPYYFKGITEDGVVNFVSAVVDHVDRADCRLYLYHMPAYTGVPYTPAIARRLRDRYGDMIAGVKDSTGDLAVSDAFVRELPDFDVFPSAESSLDQARARGFAGCISATVNVTAPLAGRYWHGGPDGDAALAAAGEIRKALQSVPLLAGVKWMVGKTCGDDSWNRFLPPIVPLGDDDVRRLAPVLERHWSAISAM